MARAVALIYALLLSACPSNPYVIGRLEDASSDAALPAQGECAAGHADALFCSGFEALDLEAEWTAAVSTRDGTLERSASRVHNGTGALHASSAGSSSYALVATSFPARESGDLYVRAYVFVPAQLPTEIMNIMFVGTGETREPFEGVDLNLQNGALQAFSPQSPQRYSDPLTIPRARWFCLRLRMAIDDSDGFVQVFVDDRLALASSAFDTLPSGGVDELRLGIDWSSAQEEPFEIYFDDVVIDSANVSCLD